MHFFPKPAPDPFTQFVKRFLWYTLPLIDPPVAPVAISVGVNQILQGQIDSWASGGGLAGDGDKNPLAITPLLWPGWCL